MTNALENQRSGSTKTAIQAHKKAKPPLLMMIHKPPKVPSHGLTAKNSTA